jgi:hypothetical protein
MGARRRMQAGRELVVRHSGVVGDDCSSGDSRYAEGQNGGTDEQFHGFISGGAYNFRVIGAGRSIEGPAEKLPLQK